MCHAFVVGHGSEAIMNVLRYLALAPLLIACSAQEATPEESSAEDLSARQCRATAHADDEECRIRGTVTSTFMDDTTCMFFVRDQRTHLTYGIVEDTTGPTSDPTRCQYTRAFDGATPWLPEVWTRFADTKALPTSEQARLRDLSPFAYAVSYVELTGELRGELPSPSASELKRAIDAAISPLGGANPARSESISLEEVPRAVRSALEDAAQEIRARSFDGTDYTAELEGYYVIYDSPAKTRVVAYVAYGTGSGEPDYHDGVIIGFDARGTRIYDNEDSG